MLPAKNTLTHLFLTGILLIFGYCTGCYQAQPITVDATGSDPIDTGDTGDTDSAIPVDTDLSTDSDSQNELTCYWSKSNPPLTSQALLDIWGSDSDNLYAVGQAGTVLHFDGEFWQPIELPETTSQSSFSSIWGSSKTDVFIAGHTKDNLALIYHFDGNAWSKMTLPDELTTDYWSLLSDIWGTAPNNVFAVGFHETILHYDGEKWQLQSEQNPSINHLQGIWGTGTNNIYAAGQTGLLQFNGVDWQKVQSAPRFAAFSDIWGIDENTVFAIGYDNAYESPAVFHYDGTSWHATFFEYRLNAIYGIDKNDLWIAADNGIVFHYRDTQWHPVDTGTTESLWGVWPVEFFINKNDNTPKKKVTLVAVGTGGTVLKQTDGTWESYNGFSNSPISQIKNIDDTVYAVSESSLLKRQANTFSPVPLPKLNKQPFHAVAGKNADNISAAQKYTFHHKTNNSWQQFPLNEHLGLLKIIDSCTDAFGYTYAIVKESIFPDANAVDVLSTSIKIFDGVSWNALNVTLPFAPKRIAVNSKQDLFFSDGTNQIAHMINGTIQVYSIPTSGLVQDIFVTPFDGVYASGFESIYQFKADTNQWITVRTIENVRYYAVWANENNEIIATGVDLTTNHGIISEFDGTIWTDTIFEETKALTSLIAADLTLALTASSNALLLKVGPTWQSISITQPATLTGICAPNEIEFFATTTKPGTLLHFRDGHFSSIQLDFWDNFSSCTRHKSGSVTAITENGSIASYEGTDDWRILHKAPGCAGITDLAQLDEQQVLGICKKGGTFIFTKNQLVPLERLTNQNLNGIFKVADNQALIVGDQGTVLSYNDWEIKKIEINTQENLTNIWGTGETDFHLVGQNGIHLYYNGIQWETTTYDGGHFQDIWGDDPAKLFAIQNDIVGGNTSLWRWTGTALVKELSFATKGLKAQSLGGQSSLDMYVGGTGGLLMHYDCQKN